MTFGEIRETAHLFHRLFIAVQYSNRVLSLVFLVLLYI